MTEQSDGLFLDSYDRGILERVWCWKNLETGESSQEFLSKKAALEAWRSNGLAWSRLEDFGD
jgi:hypothetical protein